MEISHAYLALTWGGYLALHSLLAANSVKRGFQQILGKGYRWYRLLYSLLATAGAGAIFLWGATLPAVRFIPENAVVRLVGLILATYGLLVVRLAFRQYRFSEFIGLRGHIDDDVATLKVDGVHRYVRHPLYAGLILLFLGYLLFAPTFTNLVTVACMLLYLSIGIPLEERKLVARFGDAYLEYQQEVPALIPRRRPSAE
ncbi:MAG TPA: protein-S-isoprenylcysteine methyltransferase [Cytophagales bacterium]|nr:protein-S-isoprenylcysteine methyltransferase [Cytophagales bacterium]HAA17582.1 protein-S-isoprenylcysteine methyltransferase [Cytophagales bacterium]HAP62511.1 protein-S-isoprenylcysteine methyltransferase [Cytophagales bacterium]